MNEIEMEEWMALTDEQQEAVLDREMRELQRLLDKQTPKQRYAYSRRSWLRNCLGWRRHARGPLGDLPIFREHLRKAQIGLVKLRAWRATNYQQFPGDA